jgi:hypothetical protein
MNGAIIIEQEDLPFLKGIPFKIIGKSTAMGNNLAVAVDISATTLQELITAAIELKKLKHKVIPMYPPTTKLAA